MEYEHGMQILWDVLTREIVVIFRGAVTALPDRFPDRQAGIEAGEKVCRNCGWGVPRLVSVT
ncbi:MAG: hypothetical protein JWM58_2820 [Rhizobium sp.]|jgi:hypothetical protein|nr:hypothetical protein [Rhizobium sp.]